VSRGTERSISERGRATDELQELEQAVVSDDCAPRVLSEFRGPVDSIRQTAWAVQQWTDLQSQHRDPYTVLGLLSEERVRRDAQRSRDLRIDLEPLELNVETEGLDKLFQATKGLYERLAPLFREEPV